MESLRYQRRLCRHVLPPTIPFQIDPEVSNLSDEWLAVIRTTPLLLTNYDCRTCIENLHLFVLGDETRPPDNVRASFLDVLLFRAAYAGRGDVNEVVGQNVRELIRVTAQVSSPTLR